MSYRNDKIYYTTTKMHCRSASQIITGAAQITSLLGGAPLLLSGALHQPLLLIAGAVDAVHRSC